MMVSQWDTPLRSPVADFRSPPGSTRTFRVLRWRCDARRWGLSACCLKWWLCLEPANVWVLRQWGVPELNELESSSFKDGIRWRKLLTQAAWPEILPPRLTWSLCSFQGGLTVPSSRPVSPALSPLSRFCSPSFSLPFSTFLPWPFLHSHSFLASPSPSPLLFFGLEWTGGMRVTGTCTGGRWSNKRNESSHKVNMNFDVILIL